MSVVHVVCGARQTCQSRADKNRNAMSEEVFNQKAFVYLTEVEALAQDILTDREHKLDLSNAQNKFREALRALESVEERQSWMQMGSVYIERPRTECIDILRKELASAEADLNNLNEKIKSNLSKLRDLEHQPRLQGYTLQPISLAEAKVLRKGFGDL